MLTRSKRAHDGRVVPATPARTPTRTSNSSHADSIVDAVDVESVRFMEPLFSNRVFLQTLTAQEILNIKSVSKTWAQWTAENTNNDIIRARISDDSRDWYFPLFGPADVEVKAGSSQLVPVLHGMWHATVDASAVSKLSKLPNMLYLPPPSTFSVCICKSPTRKEVVYVVRASLGGLLLVETVTKLFRNNFFPRDLNWHDHPDCTMTSTDWPALMVTNPLTKQFQVLPSYNAEVGYRWWQCSPNYFMMVDEIMNNYKVVVIGKQFNDQYLNLYLYDSTSMKWEVVHGFDRLMQPPLGMCVNPIPPMANPYFRSTYYASACASGRLYLADIRMPTDTESNIINMITAVVRLFEVDIQSGQWVLRTELPFHKTYNGAVDIQHINDVEYDTGYVHRNLELVECMGCLYAIIPARLDEFLHEPNNYRWNMWANVDTISSKYMPLQFYIFKLTGEVKVEGHGVLRIETPARNCLHLARRQRLFKRLTINHKGHVRRGGGNWFSCTAKGSIIWVSVDEYLLQYDIVLGECRTEFIPKHVQNQEKAGVAYRASFHMKP